MANELRDWISEHNEEALFVDGFDEAIIGVAERCSKDALIVYDARKVIEILMREGMDYEEASDWFSFNILGAWLGENTPLFLWRPEEDGL